ncbi:MAG: hypothetical protein OIF35_10295, partial [Cellvibrionaceae bacterium]|nr:hypothetical protein [Cellvibrionaceae bacterium]
EHMVDILLENVDPLKSEINPLDLSTVRKIELRSKHLENIEEHTQNTEPCIPNYEVEKDKEGVITNINLTCK